jgi:uncharacterized protein (DUF1501 family)
MLKIWGPQRQLCDGVTRRSFLQAGALALGGLTLADLYRVEAASGRRSHKAVIMIYLTGGLAHQDTFDLKPQAPAEVRGEFRPIPTNVPGVQICEYLPLLARCMDKFVIVRSLVGQRDEHSSWQSYTGATMDVARREQRPHFGSVVARVQGAVDPVIPPFVDLSPTMQHKPYNSPGPAQLGRSAAAVRVDGDELAVMKNLTLTPEQLQNRRTLLARIDALRAARDRIGASTMDTYHERAFEVLTSSRLVEALDVSREPVQVRERYGRGSPQHLGDGGPMWNDQLLMARRLVEVGCRVVTVAYGFWDTHGNNFRYLRQYLPLFDRGISALIEDIYARGLDRDVTVCVCTEFGRTPKINKDAGRDHWARVNCALLAGGGMRTGQVIGSTDSAAAEAKDDPIPYQNILATLYRNLGIDPHGMVYDVSNRPNPILPSVYSPVEKLY